MGSARTPEGSLRVNQYCQYKSCDLYLQLGAVPSCVYEIFLGRHAKKRIKSLFDDD